MSKKELFAMEYTKSAAVILAAMLGPDSIPSIRLQNDAVDAVLGMVKKIEDKIGLTKDREDEAEKLAKEKEEADAKEQAQCEANKNKKLNFYADGR